MLCKSLQLLHSVKFPDFCDGYVMKPCIFRCQYGIKCLVLVQFHFLCRPYGSPYARPPYMSPAQYNAAQAGMTAYRVGYTSPQSRSLAPGQHMAQNTRPYMAPQATLEQQELQRLKNLKAAIQAANRVMSITCIHSS